jgi:hypothetical protein
MVAVEKITLSPDKRRLFRGQRRDYGGKMLVSSARQTSSNAMLCQLLDWSPTLDVWQMAAQLKKSVPVSQTGVPFAGFGGSPAWDQGMITDLSEELLFDPEVDKTHIERAAMMQHYGAISDFLDCANSLEVALWFSHNDLRSRNIKSIAEDWHGRYQNLQHTFSWYEKAREGTGFIYVFDVEPFKGQLQDGILAELAEFGVGTRPYVQKAALVYANTFGPMAGDLGSFVRAAFEFPVPLPGVPRHIIEKATSDLFPSRSHDEIYDHLLGVPFYSPNPLEQSDLERMLNIPCYVNSEKELTDVDILSSYVARSEQINPSWFFHSPNTISLLLEAGTVVDLMALKTADVWLLASPTSSMVAVDLAIFEGLGAPPPFNLFLEFSPFEVLGISPATNERDFVIVYRDNQGEKVAIHRMPGCADLRALWILPGDYNRVKGFRYRAFFGWTADSLRLMPPLFFEWTPEKGVIAMNAPAEAADVKVHAFLFRYLLSICITVEAGLLKLEAFPSPEQPSRYKKVSIPSAMRVPNT